MNPAMMNPDMMKAAQQMMSKMSPEDMERMMQMSKNMDPSMMAQAQQMMSNPAMAKQAAAAMENMDPGDMRKKLDEASKGGMPTGVRAPAPAPAQSAAAKLKASPMSVPDDLICTVEDAEECKAKGNTKFKAGEYGVAASQYQDGAAKLEEVLGEGTLSGTDKQAVVELKEACHLNLANCRLKLDDYAAAERECDAVLTRGDNRKALFRRGVALQKQGKLEPARADLLKAVAMDPADAIVGASLKEVEAAMGVEPSPAPAPAPAARPPAPPAMPGMPSDPAAMEAMLDNITPEQMKAQAEMLENMDPAVLSSMAPQFQGMDPAQLKMVSSMMKNMDPQQMKSMAKMAQQMQGMGGMPGMPGMPGGASGAGPSSAGSPAAGAGGMPDMANMDMDKGLEMMENMNPDMMKAGLDMIKNMDPKAMAEMSRSMGREISEEQMTQMQGMMKDMSPEDLQKWSNRAATAAKWGKKPLAAARACYGWAAKLGAAGGLAVVVGLMGIMLVGHVTDTF